MALTFIIKLSYIVHYSLNINLCSQSKAYSNWKGILKVTLEVIIVDHKPEELLDRYVKLVKVSSKMSIVTFWKTQRLFVAVQRCLNIIDHPQSEIVGCQTKIVWTSPSSTCSLPREAKSITQENFKFNYYNEILNKLIVPDQSTSEKVSFEWSLYTISFADTKVITTPQSCFQLLP